VPLDFRASFLALVDDGDVVAAAFALAPPPRRTLAEDDLPDFEFKMANRARSRNSALSSFAVVDDLDFFAGVGAVTLSLPSESDAVSDGLRLRGRGGMVGCCWAVLFACLLLAWAW